MKTRLLSFGLICLLMLTFVLPVNAAEQKTAGLDIKLKVGSKQMTVNGKASTVTPPYLSGKTVMLPLNVATKALGAKLALKNDKIMTLTLLKHTVVITTGSKAATINGKKVTMAAAPAIKSGVTMIPSQVVEGLGAKFTYQASTKDIRITAAAQPAADNKGSGIDSDAGKSKIGDSHFGWSMNYPTGLVQSYQSDNGGFLVFEDVKQEYYLAVSVEEMNDAMSIEDVRDYLTSFAEEDGPVVDVSTLTRPSGSFQRIVVKGDDGMFYEYRGIHKSGYFYTLIYGKKAKSAKDLATAAGLLDSFQLSFDPSNKSLKDLSKVKNGLVTFKNEDYGLNIALPHEWRTNRSASHPYYRGPGESYLLMRVNSVKPGETAEEWAERRIQFVRDHYSETYLKGIEFSDIEWNGVPAKLVKLSYSNDTKIWWDEVEIFAVKGNYKYYVEFAYRQDKKHEVADLSEKISGTLKVDFAKVENTFGNVPDPNDSFNPDEKAVKTNAAFGYSITVPKHWAAPEMDLDAEILKFEGIGIYFSVGVDRGATVEGYPEQIEQSYVGEGNLKLNQKTNTTLSGVPAIKMTFESVKSASNPGKITIYLLEHNGNLYAVIGALFDVHATPVQQKRLDDAINSFKLN